MMPPSHKTDVTCSNPFNSTERQNFPAWSPMFSKSVKTPTSTERGKVFRWSIDQLAKLNPADIATSPASLAITNLESPNDDQSAQIAADKFFSQKEIFPSPWTVTTKTRAKKVTFSPLPPITSYYTKDEVTKVDASTQTALTLPMDFDLETVLGHKFYSGEETSFSLRRKLFGQPQRSSYYDNSSYHDSNDEDIPESPDTQLSSTPLRPSLSSAVIITKLSNHSPSFVENVSLEPHPSLSPVTSAHCGSPSFQGEMFRPSLDLSPIVVSVQTPEDVPSTTTAGSAGSTSTPCHLKSVSKRQLSMSPHASPVFKHQCIYRGSPTHNSTDDEGTEEHVPPPISLCDLMSDVDIMAPPTTCTTYFNNMAIEDEKPVHSIVSSWQPDIHSTMLEPHKLAPPSFITRTTDSGLMSASDVLTQTSQSSKTSYSVKEEAPINDTTNDSGINQPIISDPVMSLTTPTCDSGSGQSVSHVGHTIPTLGPSTRTSPLKYPSLPYPVLLPSRLKVTSTSHTPTSVVHKTTPTSRYSRPATNSPFSHDLLRRKSYLKAKLNFSSPRSPLQDKPINSLPVSSC